MLRVQFIVVLPNLFVSRYSLWCAKAEVFVLNIRVIRWSLILNKKQVAMLSVKGAVLEAEYFLHLLLSNYQAVKHDANLVGERQREMSYAFNAFVRSGKSALEVICKVSEECKKDYFERLGLVSGFKYLMQLARNVISHGSGDLLSGSIEIELDGQVVVGLVCSPLNEGDMPWISPPDQDAISLAIDYFIKVLEEADKSYKLISLLPVDYWYGIREWELDGMKASAHFPVRMIEVVKAAQLTLPLGYVSDFEDVSWVGVMISEYRSRRETCYPAIFINDGKYRLAFLESSVDGSV